MNNGLVYELSDAELDLVSGGIRSGKDPDFTPALDPSDPIGWFVAAVLGTLPVQGISNGLAVDAPGLLVGGEIAYHNKVLPGPLLA